MDQSKDNKPVDDTADAHKDDELSTEELDNVAGGGAYGGAPAGASGKGFAGAGPEAVAAGKGLYGFGPEKSA